MAATYDAILRIGAQVRGAGEVKALTSALGGLQRASGGISALAGSLTGLGGAVGAALGAAGLGAAAKGLIDYADNLEELAQRTGVSVEMLGKFGVAARMSGTDVEAVSGAMVRLSRNLQEIAIGKGDNAKAALDKLGLSAYDLNGRLKEPSDLMLELADRFRQLPDGSAKAAAAMALLGKSGATMVPMLNMGADAIERLDAGITGEFAQNAGIYNDRLETLKATAAGLGNALLSQLLPSLIRGTEQIIVYVDATKTWFDQNRKWVSEWAGYIVKAVNIINAGMKLTGMPTAVAFDAVKKQLDEIIAAGPKVEFSQQGVTRSAGEHLQRLEEVTAEMRDQNGESDRARAAAEVTKQQAAERLALEKSITAAVEISNRQYDRMLATMAFVTERQQQQASLRQETFSAEQAVLGIGKAQLENRLALTTNDQQRFGIIQQIAEVERRIAKAQYDAAVAQINAETELIALKRQSVAQEVLKAAQAEITAYNMGAQAEQLQRLADTRAAAMNNLQQIQQEERFANQIAAARRRSAGAQLQAANIGIQGRVEQAAMQLTPAAAQQGGQPGFYINTPNGLIPQYAKGGFITRPTLAMVGEGGESEYVVPSSKVGSFAANILGGASGRAALNNVRPFGLNELLQRRLAQLQSSRQFRGSVEGERVLKNQVARQLGFVPGAGSMPTTLRPGVSPTFSAWSRTPSGIGGFGGQKVEVRQNLRIDKVERTATGDMVTLAQAQELASKASSDAVNQLIQKLQQPSFRQQIGIR